LGDSTFIRRVVLKNYKSIAACDVRLGPLNFLVGPNGAGKSNFLEALQLVADSLSTTFERALRTRSWRVAPATMEISESMGIRLDFQLPEGISGHYAFEVKRSEVQPREECVVRTQDGAVSSYSVVGGKVDSTVAPAPPSTPGRLHLVAMSSFAPFRPIYDALAEMAFYDLEPAVLRESESGITSVLERDGGNIESIWEALPPEARERIEQYMAAIVPGISFIQTAGSIEANLQGLMFGFKAHEHADAVFFDSSEMSDGTMRAVGLLVAMFQSLRPGSPVRLVGIEEPETGLHPFAVGVLLGALREASTRTQILVTSHSPELLDDKQITAEEILAVSIQRGETRLGRIHPAERSALKEHLYTPGELLRMNQLQLDESEERLAPDALKLFDLHG